MINRDSRSNFISAIQVMVGQANVLHESADMEPYLLDWRKRYQGAARAVVKPASTDEVIAIVGYCNQHRVPLVPQGGNTSLVGAATPDHSGDAVVLNLRRMNQVRQVDALNNTITVEAGCILEDVQNAALKADRFFPLSLAAEGSCTIGGNLSTNAGGTAVLRYGNTRDLCLGLEVVTSQGQVIGNHHGAVRGLRKDNTGYDLKDLFIGAEGTLGVITAATMKLYPKPKAQVTALAAVATPHQALDFFALAQASCGATLTAFELITDFALALVEKHFVPHRSPFKQRYPYAVLIEISDHESEAHAIGLFELTIQAALDRGLITDAVISQNLTQSKQLWALRELISEAQAAEGKNIKHDISLPISRIAEFIDVTHAALQKYLPGIRMVDFGHLGDGNLHYNVSLPEGFDSSKFLEHQADINRIVHDSVDKYGGSISAEHGIGQLKREELQRYKSAAELSLMRTLKQALDPNNIMNPGKVI